MFKFIIGNRVGTIEHNRKEWTITLHKSYTVTPIERKVPYHKDTDIKAVWLNLLSELLENDLIVKSQKPHGLATLLSDGAGPWSLRNA